MMNTNNATGEIEFYDVEVYQNKATGEEMSKELWEKKRQLLIQQVERGEHQQQQQQQPAAVAEPQQQPAAPRQQQAPAPAAAAPKPKVSKKNMSGLVSITSFFKAK